MKNKEFYSVKHNINIDDKLIFMLKNIFGVSETASLTKSDVNKLLNRLDEVYQVGDYRNFSNFIYDVAKFNNPSIDVDYKIHVIHENGLDIMNKKSVKKSHKLGHLALSTVLTMLVK